MCMTDLVGKEISALLPKNHQIFVTDWLHLNMLAACSALQALLLSQLKPIFITILQAFVVLNP